MKERDRERRQDVRDHDDDDDDDDDTEYLRPQHTDMEMDTERIFIQLPKHSKGEKQTINGTRKMLAPGVDIIMERGLLLLLLLLQVYNNGNAHIFIFDIDYNNE
mmetsp:Transcript_13484/g.14824  ORF Transcript_13484/g.14824 Transcript_13484/m.14824 type:complete len:104 (-) Transcript_13484:295-606(-)